MGKQALRMRPIVSVIAVALFLASTTTAAAQTVDGEHYACEGQPGSITTFSNWTTGIGWTLEVERWSGGGQTWLCVRALRDSTFETGARIVLPAEVHVDDNYYACDAQPGSVVTFSNETLGVRIVEIVRWGGDGETWLCLRVLPDSPLEQGRRIVIPAEVPIDDVKEPLGLD